MANPEGKWRRMPADGKSSLVVSGKKGHRSRILKAQKTERQADTAETSGLSVYSGVLFWSLWVLVGEVHLPAHLPGKEDQA